MPILSLVIIFYPNDNIRNIPLLERKIKASNVILTVKYIFRNK